jgi:hypothetical protein
VWSSELMALQLKRNSLIFACSGILSGNANETVLRIDLYGTKCLTQSPDEREMLTLCPVLAGTPFENGASAAGVSAVA